MRRSTPSIFGLVIVLFVGALGYVIGANKTSTNTLTPSTTDTSAPIGGAPAETTTPKSGESVLVFDGASQTIYPLGLDGTKQDYMYKNSAGAKLDLLPSATSSALYAARAASGSSDSGATIVDLLKIPLDHSNKLTVLKTSVVSTQPIAVSPDGKHFLSVSFSNAEQDFGFTLFYNNFDDSAPVTLQKVSGGILFPAWAPDGKSAIFVVSDPSGTTIKKLVLDTKQLTNLAQLKGTISALRSTTGGLLVAERSGDSSVLKKITFEGKITQLSTFKGIVTDFLQTKNGLVVLQKPQAGSATKVYYVSGDATTGLGSASALVELTP